MKKKLLALLLTAALALTILSGCGKQNRKHLRQQCGIPCPRFCSRYCFHSGNHPARGGSLCGRSLYPGGGRGSR